MHDPEPNEAPDSPPEFQPEVREIDAPDNEAAGIDPWDAYVLARLEPLRQIKGAHVAPDLPPKVVAAALNAYLQLRPDEQLLAIFDPTKGRRGHDGFALTTRRFCWWDPLGRSSGAGPSARDEEGVEPSGPPPRGSRSVAFNKLPEAIGVSRGLGVKLDLGSAKATFGRFDRKDLDLVAEFLRDVGSAARGSVIPEPSLGAEWWVRDLPAVARATAAARAMQAEIRSFAGQVKAATPRVIATPLIAALCVGIFAMMVASGVPVLNPAPLALFAWGANFGPAVVLDGQVWRLLTSTFLHFGLLHLAFNMWCLLSAGPLVERLFGHLGFAALYLLAGIGGSLASLWFHPVIFGAGASGAIFGVFGGLLGFLVVHRHVIPPAVLKPLRASAVSFVVYNTLFGLTSPSIDNAAHLGGLASGFICGLLLQRPWPPDRGSSALPRRLVAAGGLAGGLALAYTLSAGAIRARIEGDPRVAQLLRSNQQAVSAYNDFMRAVEPRIRTLDDIVRNLDAVTRRLDRPGEPAEPVVRDLDRLISEADENGGRLRSLAVEDSELRAALGRLTSAQEHQGRALKALRSYIETEDEGLIRGPDGYEAHLAAYEQDARSFMELREGYIKAHHLTIVEP